MTARPLYTKHFERMLEPNLAWLEELPEVGTLRYRANEERERITAIRGTMSRLNLLVAELEVLRNKTIAEAKAAWRRDEINDAVERTGSKKKGGRLRM